MPSHPRTLLWVTLFALAGSGSANAASSFQSRGPGGEYVLLAGAGRLAVFPPNGGEVSLPLPPSVRISSFTAVAGGWVAAGTGQGEEKREIVIFSTGDPGEVEAMAPPSPQHDRLRSEPVLLQAQGHLVGLAWLEGADWETLGVKAAAWNGVAWEPAQSISPPGRGSQLALTGAVLEDGAWLVAWSAFDGSDDEVLWSWRRKDSWSPPRRLDGDNEVPDITPALAAVTGGAQIAWSRYDGNDYRVHTARFHSGEWQEALQVGGPGTLEPSLHPPSPGAAGGRLLYRTVRPRGWTLLDLDAGGLPRRRAGAVLGAAGGRRLDPEPHPDGPPLVRSHDSGSVLFFWPAQRQQVPVRWENLP